MIDFDAQQQLAEERRRRYAQQLLGMQAPQGQMVGRHFVAPNALQYAAQALRGIGAMRGEQLAEQDLKSLQTQRTEGTQKALADFLRQSQGTPEQRTAFQAPAFDEADAAMMAQQGMQNVTPAVAPNMQGAYAALMQAPDAGLRQMGMQGMVRIPELEAAAAQRAEDRAFRQQEADAARQARMGQLRFQQESRMAELQARNASAAEQAEMQRQFQREMAELRRSMQPQQQGYYQFIGTPQGIAVGNARTGELSLGTINGQPVTKASDDPALQGRITGAQAQAKQSVESQGEASAAVRRSDQMIAQLDQAQRLLEQNPTASGIGSALDAAGRAIGISRESAQVAGQLEALSGWLVANVPRMEGPQSNFDVQNYQTMAGKIGDRSVPVSERMAALREVKRLQEKYKEFNQARIPSATGTSPRVGPVIPSTPASNQPRRIVFDAQGNIVQ